MRRRYDAHTVGATRWRLAARLAEVGLAAAPEDLRPAQGRERSDWRLDIHRWDGFATTTDGRYGLIAGATVGLSSWDTMTACARQGVVIDKDQNGGALWVSAREDGDDA